MNQPIQFYKSQIEIYQSKLVAIKKKLLLFSLARIAVYLAGIMGVYNYFHQIETTVIIAIVAIAIFLILVSKYTDLKKQKNLFYKFTSY